MSERIEERKVVMREESGNVDCGSREVLAWKARLASPPPPPHLVNRRQRQIQPLERIVCRLEVLDLLLRPPPDPTLGIRAKLFRLPDRRPFDVLWKGTIRRYLVEEDIVLTLGAGTTDGDHGDEWEVRR